MDLDRQVCPHTCFTVLATSISHKSQYFGRQRHFVDQCPITIWNWPSTTLTVMFHLNAKVFLHKTFFLTKPADQLQMVLETGSQHEAKHWQEKPPSSGAGRLYDNITDGCINSHKLVTFPQMPIKITSLTRMCVDPTLKKKKIAYMLVNNVLCSEH